MSENSYKNCILDKVRIFEKEEKSKSQEKNVEDNFSKMSIVQEDKT